MTSPDASPFARILADGLSHPRYGLIEEDLRDLVRILGHELELHRAATAHYEQVAALARVVLADPERDLTEKAYDEHPLRRPGDPDADQLRGWYGSWRVALITAIRWTVSPNRGIQSRLRREPRREHWTAEEAALRLRDAARDLGVDRCAQMLSREYAELAELYWQRRRLSGNHPRRIPDRGWLVGRFGKFDAACAWADDFFGLGKDGQDVA